MDEASAFSFVIKSAGLLPCEKIVEAIDDAHDTEQHEQDEVDNEPKFDTHQVVMLI